MRVHSFLLLFLLLLAPAARGAERDCGGEMRARVLAPVSPASKSIELDCSLRLAGTDIVTKQLVFKGAKSSGITLDCDGATLRAAPGADAGTRLSVLSSAPATQAGDDKWTPAENILIKNCVIEGAVRVRGMAANGEDKTLTASSRREGHSGRVRANAPSGIVFSRNKFIGQGTIPIYFAPGVHDSMILDSQIGGHSNSVAIYLDAESGDNTIKGNRISTETTLKQSTSDKARNALYSLFNRARGESNAPSLSGRELIAIDGSARNRIINNHFSNLDNGGIFLYRNCGEGGNIRHQTPNGNEIVNNVFYYDKFNGRIPAIWLASRNGNRSYCALDQGYPLGSSMSDLDHASENVVAWNQFHKFEPGQIIRDQGERNHVAENSKIAQPINRKAGCFFKDGQPSRFLADQAIVLTTMNAGLATCSVREHRCEDGVVSTRTLPCAAPG